MCALAWTAMSIAMPKFDAKRQIAVTEAASSITDAPIQVSLAGMEATLSGSVESEQQRNSLLGSIGLRTGVLRVRDNLEIIESSVSAPASDSAPVQTISGETQQADTEKRPSLSIKIIGKSLSIEGELAPEDDTTSLLQQALTTFNLDLVNNKIEENNKVQPADWLPELESIIAEMENMANPTIDIKGRQIVFAGDAPSEKVHDAVINQALDSLRTLSIIEQISIDESLADASSGKEPIDVVDGPLAHMETGPTDRALEEDIITQEERQAAEQRLAEVQRKAEAARIAQQEREAAEAEERAEQERLAAEQRLADVQRKAEEARIAQQEREAAEAEERAEQERLAAEQRLAEVQRKAEQARIAQQEREAAEAEERAEQERLAAEQRLAEVQRKAEQARIAQQEREAAEAEERAEQERLAAEQRLAEVQRKAEQARIAQQERQAAEAEERAEQERLAAEQRLADVQRKAEEARIAQQERQAAEAQARAEQERAEQERLAAEQRLADVQRKAEEARIAQQERQAAEAQARAEQERAEQERLAAEAQARAEQERAEQERLAAEQRLADVQRKAEEAKIAQQEREAAEAERIASQEGETESPQSPDTLALTENEELNASAISREQLQKALSRLPSLQILFEKNTNLLVEDSEALLQAIAELLMQFPDITVSIEGHTDSTGPSEVNLTLSLARATAVRDYLVGLGVSELRLRARGFGEAIPITDNDTPQGRATNRRIEFKF